MQISSAQQELCLHKISNPNILIQNVCWHAASCFPSASFTLHTFADSLSRPSNQSQSSKQHMSSMSDAAIGMTRLVSSNWPENRAQEKRRELLSVLEKPVPRKLRVLPKAKTFLSTPDLQRLLICVMEKFQSFTNSTKYTQSVPTLKSEAMSRSHTPVIIHQLISRVQYLLQMIKSIQTHGLERLIALVKTKITHLVLCFQ